ncbi:hypothetical protein K438DRAFT_2105458 [Mycena galopus ATCC 62051]|nr:hypothetical protein K438DRAFT_2105458 [Mycena galopus ATCC 62051]
MLSLKDRQPSPAARTPATCASYASALKAKPTDWHLEFSMDDQVLPLDLRICGAMHHQVQEGIWAGASNRCQKAGEGVLRVRHRAPRFRRYQRTLHILRLLRVLHQLNTLEAECSVFIGEKRNLPESVFVNNKLTAKLTCQLSCLPDWALDLPQHFPFLFPFTTCYNFLQSASFTYTRLILKWQSQQTRVQDPSRQDEGIGFLGRLQRQKVRISHKHILESAVKVFKLYGSSSSVLEVEYFEEVRTRLSPTLVSKEFARKNLKICPENIASDGAQKRTHIFRVIGQFVAKAMLDSRIIDLSLKIVLGEEVPLTVATLRLMDISLANSLDKIQSIVSAKAQAENDKHWRPGLTLPFPDVTLSFGNRENVNDYAREVLDGIVGQGTTPRKERPAVREGFSKVFPISDLQTFSADEQVLLFGNLDEDWSVETLSEGGPRIQRRGLRNLRSCGDPGGTMKMEDRDKNDLIVLSGVHALGMCEAKLRHREWSRLKLNEKMI